MANSNTTSPADMFGAIGALTVGARMPLFYNAPKPLTPERHGRLGIASDASHAFAATANVVPLNVHEFALAIHDYPIVFATSPPYLPMAVCGLHEGRNLFVDADGNWAPDTYVPDYVRRFPFIFLERPEDKRLVLCVDELADIVAESSERPLYNGDKPSAFTRQMLSFCRKFHAQHLVTRRFAARLAEQGLLRENTADLRLVKTRRISIKGFSTVDRDAFAALSDEAFLGWRKGDGLLAIYVHHTSVANWLGLVRRAHQRSGDD